MVIERTKEIQLVNRDFSWFSFNERVLMEITVIIRAISYIQPRKNIRLVRSVDKFLEHAMVYCCHNDGDEKMYMGSADWMERNLYRRMEVVFPILDQA